MNMFKHFTPDRFLNSYRDLLKLDLKELKIRHIFMDIDNTLAPYYDEVAPADVRDDIHELLKKDVKITLISNNKPERVAKFAASLNLPYAAFSLKPLPFTYRRLLKENGLKKEEVLCVGDQLITDVLGAKLADLKVYYTEPLVEKDSWSTKFNRFLEKKIMQRIR